MCHDLRLELGYMTGVVTSTEVSKCDQSRDIRSESYLPIRVGHTIGVTLSEQSHTYD
jgi:hypothetical protein